MGYSVKNIKLELSYIVLLAAVFSLGFGTHLLYVSLLIVYIIINPPIVIKASIDRDYLVLVILLSLFLIPQYTIGYNNTTLDNPILSMSSVMFGIVIFGLIGHTLSVDKMRGMVVFLVLGVGGEALTSILYSYYMDPILYGYGLLYNPIMDREINSPGAALKVSLLASMFMWFFFEKKRIFIKLFFLIGIIILSIFAAWLASRAYFVVVIIAFIIAFVLLINIKRALNALVVLLIAIFITPFTLDVLDISIFNQLNRLEGGLESARFLLWKDGFNKLLSHPFGGFSVDQEIDPVDWFHNIFIDAGRLAGWLPIFGLFLFLNYVFYLFLLNRNKHTFFAGFVFVVTFVLAQQDVVVEAMIRFIIILFFSAILLSINSTKDCNNPTN